MLKEPSAVGFPGRYVNEATTDLWQGRRLRVIRKSKRLRLFFLRRGISEKVVRAWMLDNPYMQPHARRTMLSHAVKYRRSDVFIKRAGK